MIDFHTHILPGIDDGSRDIDMTEHMLEMEQQSGVSHIYATPHFYAHRISVDKFLERRDHALMQIRELLEARPELPGITPGAEVYYFSGMGKAAQLPELCIEDTDLLLLEMPFAQWDRQMTDDVREIIYRRRLRVILAHVERYEQFQRNRDAWDEIIDMPLTIQMNAGPFIRGGHSRRFCLKMLKNYDNCIIGTDCHNLTDRRPNLDEARTVIEKKAGAARLLQLDEYTEKLLPYK